MNRKISIAASLLAAASLSGCAVAPGVSSFLPTNFTQQQQQAAKVTPAIVVSVSPASVGGFWGKARQGQDIVVKTLTQPAQMLSVVQPQKPGAPVLTMGEQVGVVTRNGNAHVIPLPGYSPGIDVMHWPSAPAKS